MLAALMLWLPAEAQLHRGARTIVRGGMFVKPDSLRHKSDSLANNALARELDSLMALDFTADSLAVTALRTDDIRATDSLMQLRLAGIKTEPDSMRHKKGWLMSDSMSLSKVCWISTVLPGYGQIYNKQYWKLPILYGTVGAGLALYINENRTYKPLKREYDAYTDKNLTRTPELDALQAKMIRSNTRRQVYLGLTVASYIYFIGDAAAWADYLAGEGFRRVVLIGHSEGALIAFCAAQQTPKVAAVVSLAGAGYPLDEILQLQLASQLLPDNMDLLLQANAITAALKRGERVESCPPQLEALFHPSVQTFWISSLRYDPREEIRKVRVPILVVGGDNDLQVPPGNAEALAKAQPRARKAIIAGMTHPLKKCTGRTRIDQMGAYGDSTLPIDPDLVAVVTEFIRGL